MSKAKQLKSDQHLGGGGGATAAAARAVSACVGGARAEYGGR